MRRLCSFVRVSREFDLLGDVFTPVGLEVAPRAVEHCVERVSQLYEQGSVLVRIGTYVQRWLRWVRTGLPEIAAEACLRAWETCGPRDAFLSLPPPLPWPSARAPELVPSDY
jgi:hypothetical protein